ncbi:pentatricopeptide repeat-containing protein At5g50280, chloroplastic [Prosopis cineraria]|uniref:pentatricopeptide repeat-containing protein At5g50280, chloroplastic n=1 Tax=Prosopis cineraria TaxID=364024 RepID=UPI00240EBC5D|nr:pentatricopeptide repeat-containing protein At5g50280, chloroplastic [Prosopis cineraria]XP_054807976.1 pentatricopeptide repeat-containing protein At5g50280, chloroplastic [Prosopis cineraria]XP_054807977.1 pentatricopeptide repeat-containing protein At5g50280, chloroplastic [Prosopis cineraria]
MALIHHQFLPSRIFVRRFNSPHKFSKPSLFLCYKTPNLLSLCAPHSSGPIFLPLLEEEQRDEEEEEEIDAVAMREQVEDPDDPIYRFFKSRASTSDQDPQHEGKLTLQKNRRVSWHLASDAESVEETEIDLNPDYSFVEEQEELLERKESPGGVVGEIVQIARNLPENLTLGEVLNVYEGRVDKTKCLEVLGFLGEEGRLFDCMYFFEWMRLQEPSLVTPRACSVLFPVLGRAGMGDKLMVLFRNLPSSKEFRDVRVYNAATSGLLYSGRYEDAWKLYESMEHDNIRPDHVTCSIVITIIRKLGHSAKDAWQFFEKMNRKGVRWSEEVFGALIKSFCDERLIKEALIIQSEMETKGVSSNAIVYNTLMDAFIKSNYIEEAEGLFVEMKAKGIKPTAATFNILMYAYSRRMQPQVVEKLMAEMEDAGLNPDAKSYTCLINAYGKQKKMSDVAADAFLKMKKAGIKPTSHSYTALIHAYSVSGWHEKAYMAFENMQKEGLKPSIETYTALLDAYRRAGDTQTLMKIWKLMISDKIEGTRVTFNTLLDGFAKQGHYVEARDVISEFGKIGLHPTVMTYNMLMNAYARGGQHSKLPQLLKEMAVLNLKPDSVTYSTMIYAYVRVRDFKRAFFYHKKMVKSGQVPDPISYKKLRAILDVKVATKNRKDRSAILGIINSKMGMVKDKKKKDEFWKYKKKHTKTSQFGPSVPRGKH